MTTQEQKDYEKFFNKQIDEINEQLTQTSHTSKFITSSEGPYPSDTSVSYTSTSINSRTSSKANMIHAEITKKCDDFWNQKNIDEGNIAFDQLDGVRKGMCMMYFFQDKTRNIESIEHFRTRYAKFMLTHSFKFTELSQNLLKEYCPCTITIFNLEELIGQLFLTYDDMIKWNMIGPMITKCIANYNLVNSTNIPSEYDLTYKIE